MNTTTFGLRVRLARYATNFRIMLIETNKVPFFNSHLFESRLVGGPATKKTKNGTMFVATDLPHTHGLTSRVQLIMIEDKTEELKGKGDIYIYIHTE
jgi:hypothetical protein